jgi:hypothetical protein
MNDALNHMLKVLEDKRYDELLISSESLRKEIAHETRRSIPSNLYSGKTKQHHYCAETHDGEEISEVLIDEDCFLILPVHKGKLYDFIVLGGVTNLYAAAAMAERFCDDLENGSLHSSLLKDIIENNKNEDGYNWYYPVMKKYDGMKTGMANATSEEIYEIQDRLSLSDDKFDTVDDEASDE